MLAVAAAKVGAMSNCTWLRRNTSRRARARRPAHRRPRGRRPSGSTLCVLLLLSHGLAPLLVGATETDITVVDTSADLISALENDEAHVVLRAGVYALTSDMCSDGRLCLTQAVRIEAEVAGTVVLDAQQGNRVLYISGTGAELVGLNITGGYQITVRSPDLNPRALLIPH